MPAKSKKQQEFFGVVKAYKEHKISGSEVSPAIKKAAKSMSMRQIDAFARTKRKGLPVRVRRKKK